MSRNYSRKMMGASLHVSLGNYQYVYYVGK
jgi:hypothetical protein